MKTQKKTATALNTEAIASRILKTEMINWRELQFIQQDNFKQWIDSGEQKLKKSLLKYQFVDPFKVWQHEGVLYCLDGKHRFTDLLALANTEGVTVPDLLPATFIECETMKEAAELVLVFSSAYASITQEGMFDFVSQYDIDFSDINDSINLFDFDTIEFEAMFSEGESQDTITPSSLQDSFIVPPFSILDSRQGYWQERKRKWQSLGFNSQETREDVELIAKSGQSTAIYDLRNKMREKLNREPDWDEIISYAKKKGMHVYQGASIFDPVLAELAYRWFCPEAGMILDPFAGGSVRGIVAGFLGYKYNGIDLRSDQVQANVKQAELLNLSHAANWQTGDSNEVLDSIIPGYDFIFSCPPYHDLEKYSDDPADLSNMDYDSFLAMYKSIIEKSVSKLNQDRFACFVVGDIRDKKTGFYRNFVSDTISAFQDAGAKLYNEMILVNVAGSLAIRVRRQFNGGRKIGKMHQNVLVFYKGDPLAIKQNFPDINIEDSLIDFE